MEKSISVFRKEYTYINENTKDKIIFEITDIGIRLIKKSKNECKVQVFILNEENLFLIRENLIISLVSIGFDNELYTVSEINICEVGEVDENFDIKIDNNKFDIINVKQYLSNCIFNCKFIEIESKDIILSYRSTCEKYRCVGAPKYYGKLKNTCDHEKSLNVSKIEMPEDFNPSDFSTDINPDHDFEKKSDQNDQKDNNFYKNVVVKKKN